MKKRKFYIVTETKIKNGRVKTWISRSKKWINSETKKYKVKRIKIVEITD